MQSIDWTTFTKRISINTSIENIFACLDSQEGLERWFLAKAAFQTKSGSDRSPGSSIETGDQYTWMWHGSDYIGTGEVLENNGKDGISFTFEGCKVVVNITTIGTTQIVELIQSQIPTDENSKKGLYAGCSSGWTFYLANLKSILEGGIDLRNKDINLKGVINT